MYRPEPHQDGIPLERLYPVPRLIVVSGPLPFCVPYRSTSTSDVPPVVRPPLETSVGAFVYCPRTFGTHRCVDEDCINYSVDITRTVTRRNDGFGNQVVHKKFRFYLRKDFVGGSKTNYYDVITARYSHSTVVESYYVIWGSLTTDMKKNDCETFLSRGESNDSFTNRNLESDYRWY